MNLVFIGVASLVKSFGECTTTLFLHALESKNAHCLNLIKRPMKQTKEGENVKYEVHRKRDKDIDIELVVTITSRWKRTQV